MQPIKFFKLQAKNLYKDYKTQFTNTEHEISTFDYSPKYFDINEVFVAYEFDNINEIEAENFSLMQAQHLFSLLLGYKSWSDLINAPIKKQELSMLLFKNKFDIEEWSSHVAETNSMNAIKLTYEEQIELLNEYYIGRDTIFNERDTFLLHDF